MTAEGGAGTRLALVEVAHLSDTGRVRHHNEDRSVASSRILAVADGMGGAKAGEVAAQVAVDSVSGPRPRSTPRASAGPSRGPTARSGGWRARTPTRAGWGPR